MLQGLLFIFIFDVNLYILIHSFYCSAHICQFGIEHIKFAIWLRNGCQVINGSSYVFEQLVS